MKLLKNAIFGIMLVLSTSIFSSVVVATSPIFDAKALAVKAVNNELSEEFIKSLSYDEFISIAKEVAVSTGIERVKIEKFLKDKKNF